MEISKQFIEDVRAIGDLALREGGNGVLDKVIRVYQAVGIIQVQNPIEGSKISPKTDKQSK